ncbi:MAG: ABC transporter substrate-binding protein [Tissierellaceae bacterium]
MKSKGIRDLVLLSITIILVFSIAACSADDIVSTQDENQSKDIAENEIIVITDHLGREVEFKEPAETIVSGYYITTSMMIALDLKDNVVGLEARPEMRPIYSLAASEFLELPTVGTMKEFDLEAAAALEPDLVVLSVRLQEAVKTLEELGIKVIAVNPESMEELKESLIMIGKATGREDRAQELIQYYDEKAIEIEEMVKDREKKSVYLAGNKSYLSTTSNKMYQHTLIETAGGNNVTRDIDDTYWVEISYEQLLDYNPDIIIAAPAASYTKEDILCDASLKGISAIENDDIYFMPSSFESWDSPVPSAIVGTMWLTSVLHEDVYPFDEFKEDTYDFYEEFYNIEIDMDELTK